MPITSGPVVHPALRLLAFVVFASVIVVARPSAAQQPEPEPPATPAFMSRFDFHLSAVGLVSDDDRFTWDTHWGGDVDVVDYVVGRAKVLVDYEALLGSEFRPFDPNQGNYVLEVSASARAAGTEVAGVFHHVSRHVSDRPKTFAIAWNVAGVRALRRLTAGSTRIDLRADAGRVVQRAFVDYAWTAAGDVRVDHPVRPRVGVYGRASGELYGVNEATSARGTQTGGLVEAGVRFGGEGGALELYGGVEKRIDADQIEGVPVHWAFAGFRLVNR